jgi:hypothetical protein
MLNEIGINKLSKYHFYKNEVEKFNKYKNDAIKRFGSLNELPIEVKYCIEREKARIERYARENSIHDISREILTADQIQ